MTRSPSFLMAAAVCSGLLGCEPMPGKTIAQPAAKSPQPIPERPPIRTPVDRSGGGTRPAPEPDAPLPTELQHPAGPDERFVAVP